MQRFLLSLLVILGSSSLFAQSIEDIEGQLAKGELDKAKASVDGFLAKEKNANKADGWWYKGVVYNEIAKSEKYKSLAHNFNKIVLLQQSLERQSDNI